MKNSQRPNIYVDSDYARHLHPVQCHLPTSSGTYLNINGDSKSHQFQISQTQIRNVNLVWNHFRGFLTGPCFVMINERYFGSNFVSLDFFVALPSARQLPWVKANPALASWAEREIFHTWFLGSDSQQLPEFSADHARQAEEATQRACRLLPELVAAQTTNWKIAS